MSGSCTERMRDVRGDMRQMGAAYRNVIIVLLVVFMFLLPAIGAAVGECVPVARQRTNPTTSTDATGKSEPEKEELPSEIIPVKVFLKDQFKLLPGPFDDRTEPKYVSCPARTEPLHPLLPGIIITGVFVESELMTFWESNSLRAPLEVVGPVSFSLSLTSTEDNIGSAKFQFILKQDENILAKTKEVGAIDGVSVRKDEIVSFQASAPLNLSGALALGSKLSLHLVYWVNGDGLQIVYNSQTSPSQIILNTNSLKMVSVHGCKHTLRVEYHEAFGGRPTDLLFEVKIDKVNLDSELQYDVSDEGNHLVTWSWHLGPGTHAAEVSISYGLGEANVTATATIIVPEEKQFVLNLFLFKLNLNHLLIVLVVAIAIVIVVLFKRRRKSREDADLEMFEEYIDYEDENELFEGLDDFEYEP